MNQRWQRTAMIQLHSLGTMGSDLVTGAATIVEPKAGCWLFDPAVGSELREVSRWREWPWLAKTAGSRQFSLIPKMLCVYSLRKDSRGALTEQFAERF